VKKRRYDTDWLRVIAMLAVFIFHCMGFFDTEGWFDCRLYGKKLSILSSCPDKESAGLIFEAVAEKARRK
jgi:hypothetical protein